ncbi:hypothetical protein GCM10011514_18840 [Emticicia aquatilis]|uniref:Fibronectin type-III domain-containing protein n=2 Tax=Emticicia aquatilis TaxID=1537369 RepID=A0A916YPT4_9BACT|nr:hypothetical protein GCM10011514_18840 [Emticicia aquatilis]
MLFGWQKTFAQADTLCDPNENKKIFGELYFNYGSVTNAYSAFNRSTFVMGQPLASPRNMLSQSFQGGFGVYSPFYLPPQPPILIASQGDFKDRIKVSWNVNPLSTPPTGFILYRDGSFLADLGENVREFLDFNTQAGEYYEYSIVAKNVFGTGSPSKYVGFVNPNGVVSGKVSTNSGNPVPGVEVRLTPLTGNSMAFDGVNDELCVTYHDEFPTDKFTVSAYVKLGDVNNEGGIIDWGSTINKNWWITTTKNNEPKGYVFHIGNGTGSDSLKYYLPNLPTNPFNVTDWHQVTMVYNGAAMSVMVDGEFVGTKPASIVREKNYLNIGSKIGNDGFFKGKIDDIRVYNRPLTQTEVNSTKNRSVSKSESGLVSYWKMDEGVGAKVFDNTAIPTNANIYGATFSSDKPEVYSAGITDVTGYYVIDGINYSQNEGFRATPIKNFEFNSALEFNAADKSYGNLTDYDMPDTSTVEVLFYPFDIKSRQTVLSKGNLYEAYIENGKLFLNLNGTITDLGAIRAKYYHLAVSLDNTAGNAKIYLEGELKGTVSFTGTSNWKNGNPWLLATNSTNATTGKFYTGLVDEFYIYKTALPQNVIQEHYVLGVPQDSTTNILFSHFDLNEGSDTKVYDYAAINFGASVPREGTILKASWSNNARRKETKPHEFEPNVRVVNLNTSNTAVGNIDFKDVSTVNVSGYVRFSNTFCFADSINILVNGQENFPPIRTDRNGKWSADFEPGRTIKLSASYKDHLFSPSFFEIRKIQAPKAGIVFLDNTKRTITGQVAGNDICRKSIIPNGSRVVIKVATLDGCFEKTDTLRNPDGKFMFKDLPARAFRISVVEHSNSVIYNYFQAKGGQQVDLRDNQTANVDFIYIAPPKVELAEFAANNCGVKLLPSFGQAQTNIRVYENYDGGKCYLSNAKLTITNDIADGKVDTLTMQADTYKYVFSPGLPNLILPYKKLLTVTADVNGALATDTTSAIVLGQKPRITTFTTRDPEIPEFILRDPPGDASYATWEKGTTKCNQHVRTVTNVANQEATLELKLGTKQNVSFFGAASLETKITNTFSVNGGSNQTWVNSSVTNNCITATETISTSANDKVVGSTMGGDVYIGTAKNVEYGIADELNYDFKNCKFTIKAKPIIGRENIATTFIYSEFQILNDVIPSLYSLKTKKDSLSANLWYQIVAANHADYFTGELIESISFDAGAVRDWSRATDNSTENSFEFQSVGFAEFAYTYGLEVNESGFSGNVKLKYEHTKSNNDTETNQESKVLSYHLEDDDVGDNYSVEVRYGKRWDSPTFKINAAETSCPWEQGVTARRSAPVLKSLDGVSKVNVPSNTAAVYRLQIGNESPTRQIMNYDLSVDPASNPNGAIIRLNGQPLTQPVTFTVAPDEPQEVTLTIDRGPIEYNYEDLIIQLETACETELADARGGDALVDKYFVSTVALRASFIEPCSKVDIGFPLQDFVITPASGNKLSITLNEYDKGDDDLKLIRLQYRPIGGDGSWININETLKDDLGAVFTIKEWDSSLLKDGPYEIRAVAECFNPNLAPGISTVIKGEVARTPPVVFGVPEPGDGTWDPGDEISITFNEPIDCNKVVQADILANNTIGLYDATTNALVDATITCTGNKIIITPNINPVFFENRTFRVVVSGKDYDDAMLAQNPNHQRAAIRDKAGNMIEKTIKWEFAVNQNNLEWVGTDIIETNEVLKPFSIKRQVRNRGGSIASFRMENVPSWLTVTPSTGTLNPGQTADVTFTFQQDLLIGDYTATLNLVGSKGKEPMGIDYRVRCPQPNFVVDNPSQYESSMNIVARLSIFDKFSVDPSDVVVAKINGQIRGVGKVAYYRNIPAADATIDGLTGKPKDESNRWLVFMTVFGDDADNDKPIEFRVWDGDKCNEYVEVINRINFQTGDLVGSPIAPDTIQVINVVKKCIPLNRGWNWVSFNLNLPEGNTVTNVLASMKFKPGTIIKSEDFSAKYYGSPINGWKGSLVNITPQKRYMINVSEKDTICMKGSPYLTEEFPITISPGWNWVGYVPSTGMTVSQALKGLTPLNGDIIKSQTLFAQYVAGIGWIGNLSFLEPLKGYLLKISNAGTLVYPTGTTNRPTEEITPTALLAQAAQEAPMIFDFTKYQLTMNLIGKVNGMTIDADDELRAYINGQLVGVNKSIAHSKDRLFFQTIYFEDESNINFKLYKADRKKEYSLNRTIPFKSETLAGLVEAPIIFNLESANLVPITIDIKDQLIWQPSKIFPTVSIPAAVSGQSTACGSFTFNSVLPVGTETKPVCVSQTGLEGNMTGVMKINYNERSTFVSSNDVLSFVNPTTGLTVGCATFDSQFNVFNFTVKGGVTSAETPIDVKYYSNVMKKTFVVKSGVTYKNNKELGDYITPAPLDVSPLTITNNNGVITAVMRDTSWTGKYCVDAFALNCPNFGDGQTTFCFQRLKQGACLDVVVRNVTEGTNDVVKAVSISSQVVVNSGIRLEYKGGNKIELKPGFETKPGTVFTGKIEGCSN